MTLIMKAAFGCLLVAAVSFAAPAEAKSPAEAIEAKLVIMRQLSGEKKWNELIEQFKDEDFTLWPSAFGADRAGANAKIVEACMLRGRAYAGAQESALAEKDLRLAGDLSPSDAYFWHNMGELYLGMKDSQKALEAYNRAFELSGDNKEAKSYNWMPINATLESAAILMGQTRYTEALKVMERYNDKDMAAMGTYWGCRLLRAYGQIYAGMGREDEALAKFKAALELEKE